MLRIHNRDIQEDEFYLGSQWWDITENVVDMALEQEVHIKKSYQYSACSDEGFLQPMI